MLGISNEALQHFVDGNKGFLFLETLAGIKQAIRRKKPIAEICSINSKDVIATIEKEGWEIIDWDYDEQGMRIVSDK